jgi:hypothetical protein
MERWEYSGDGVSRNDGGVMLMPKDSEPALELLKFHLDVGENLTEQAGADGFAGMNRNNCSSSVWMLQKVVAAFDAQHDEPTAP